MSDNESLSNQEPINTSSDHSSSEQFNFQEIHSGDTTKQEFPQKQSEKPKEAYAPVESVHARTQTGSVKDLTSSDNDQIIQNVRHYKLESDGNRNNPVHKQTKAHQSNILEGSPSKIPNKNQIKLSKNLINQTKMQDKKFDTQYSQASLSCSQLQVCCNQLKEWNQKLRNEMQTERAQKKRNEETYRKQLEEWKQKYQNLQLQFIQFRSKCQAYEKSMEMMVLMNQNSMNPMSLMNQSSINPMLMRNQRLQEQSSRNKSSSNQSLSSGYQYQSQSSEQQQTSSHRQSDVSQESSKKSKKTKKKSRQNGDKKDSEEFLNTHWDKQNKDQEKRGTQSLIFSSTISKQIKNQKPQGDFKKKSFPQKGIEQNQPKEIKQVNPEQIKEYQQTHDHHKDKEQTSKEIIKENPYIKQNQKKNQQKEEQQQNYEQQNHGPRIHGQQPHNPNPQANDSSSSLFQKPCQFFVSTNQLELGDLVTVIENTQQHSMINGSRRNDETDSIVKGSEIYFDQEEEGNQKEIMREEFVVLSDSESNDGGFLDLIRQNIPCFRAKKINDRKLKNHQIIQIPTRLRGNLAHPHDFLKTIIPNTLQQSDFGQSKFRKRYYPNKNYKIASQRNTSIQKHDAYNLQLFGQKIKSTTDFFRHNWLNLIVLTLVNCEITNNQWMKISNGAQMYLPHLKLLIIAGNPQLQVVMKSDLEKFKGIQEIYFTVDDIDKYKGIKKCGLSPKSKQEIEEYKKEHEGKVQVYY